MTARRVSPAVLLATLALLALSLFVASSTGRRADQPGRTADQVKEFSR